ncbi:Mu transposase domain-containing protein [Streptomyces chisholmiae]|uniref:Mu transposase domain-containing protein n=1 Tax=Streptomyces chisholmiae TaxID=3075540 RepID=UPI00374E2001
MSVRVNRYSVAVRLIGRIVRAMLHVCELVVCDGREKVARYVRLIGKGGACLGLEHHPKRSCASPAAFPGATVLDQVRSVRPVHFCP